MLHQVEEHPADRFGMFTNHRVFGGVEALTTVGVLLIDLPGVWVAHSRQYAQPGSPTSALTVPGSTGSNTTTAPVTSAPPTNERISRAPVTGRIDDVLAFLRREHPRRNAETYYR